MHDIVLAADLGGTNLRMAAVGGDGTILHHTKCETPRDVTPDHLINISAGLVAECRAALRSYDRIIRIGFAAPANITADGVLRHLPNLPSLEGMPLRSALSERFGLPVTLENDATAAAVGEHWIGASKDVDDSIMVTLGTGVGGGVIIDGKPLRGVDGTAGKIGHICVEPDGHPCGCGSWGCVEQYASATAIVRLANEAGLAASTSLQVYEAAMSGDNRAHGVFVTMGSHLGLVLAGLINALNPQMIVVGGGAAAAWDAFISVVTDEIGRRAFSEPAATAKIVRGLLGDDAGILGAAHSAFRSGGAAE